MSTRLRARSVNRFGNRCGIQNFFGHIEEERSSLGCIFCAESGIQQLVERLESAAFI